MKNKFNFLIILSLFILLLCPKSLNADYKSVKIAVAKDLIPFSFVDDDNQIRGLLIDYWKLWSERSGVKVIFVPAPLSKTLSLLKNKEVDIHFGMALTEKRKTEFIFLNKLTDIKSSFHINKDDNNFNNISDLFNKKVGVIKNGFLEKYLINNYPLVNISPYTEYTKMIKDLEDKKIASILDVNLIMSYQFAKRVKAFKFHKIKEFELKKSIFVAIKKGDKKLQNIVQKGLDKITKEEISLLEKKWQKSFDLNNKIKTSLDIAFSLGREPYSFNKRNFKGIEFDLIKEIFNMNNIDVNKVQYFKENFTTEIFSTNKNIDLISNIEDGSSEFYYSDGFISFQNVVISRKKDNIIINNIDDLKGKSIISFFNSYKYLGDRYNKLFNKKNRTPLYKEVRLQKEQVEDFLNKKVDLLVIDKNIFSWQLTELSNKNINEFRFDYIFKGKNTLKVAFKDKRLRDIFNKNLKKIKENGTYEHIFNNYLTGKIEAKSKISLLLSSLISKSLYNNDLEILRDIGYLFFNLPFIEKIEVFNINNQKEVSYSNNELTLTKVHEQDIFYVPYGTPQKIGKIKINFKEKELQKYSTLSNIIPSITFFKDLDNYDYIKNIYINFNYFDKKINFSLKEKEFIRDNKDIIYATLNWEPISILYKNELIGLLPDYLKIIEQKTGLNFIYKQLATWKDINSEFKDNKIDLVPNVDIGKNINIKALESNEITNFRFAIVTKERGSFADKISDLENKTLALPKGFPNYNFIKKYYPNIKVVEAKSMKEALSFVAKDKADAFVAFSEVAIYNVKKYFPNLKIVGITNDIFTHNFLIQKDYPELLSIINKVLKSITYKEKQDIRDKWIDEEVNTAVDYTLIYTLVLLFLFILLIVLFFMNKYKKAKEEMEGEKKKFETLFSDSADAIFLAKDGVYIDVNNASIKLFRYNSKEEMLKLKPGVLAPKYQENGILSTVLMKTYFKECFTNGTIRCQWQSKKSTGEVFWVEFVFTKLKYNNENVLHLLCRDINDKKLLEKELNQRTHDIEHSNEELEDSNEELQTTIQNLKEMQNKLIESEKMASLGGLVAGVAHEINTPVGIGLTGITHFKEMTSDILDKYKKEKMSQEDFEEYLNTSNELGFLIHKNLEKAANLVRSFKQVAVDQSSEKKREFNLAIYLDEILHSIHSVTKKTNINITYTCNKDIKVNSYPGYYSQIITNLIMNSIIHAFIKDEVGNIHIDVKKENNSIRIVYTDTGKGIKKEDLGKIFDPFFTTNRDNGGSGLGLNIIYNIITSRLNGSIKCISEVNQGIEFTIILKV